jgi:hypothetical protein
MGRLLWASFAFAYGMMAALVVFISRRHNWARVTFLVITILGIAVMVYPWEGMNADYWEIFSPSNVVFAAMDGVALYWLFSGSGAAWYAAKRQSVPKTRSSGP